VHRHFLRAYENKTSQLRRALATPVWKFLGAPPDLIKNFRMSREQILLRRIRWFTWLFIIGLALSGATAIPLHGEVNLLVNLLGADGRSSEIVRWLLRVQDALTQIQGQRPFLFYGTDWLAFGHFVIAIAFIGALRDPIRNRWLFDFGLIACVLVIPYALVFGGLRDIPFWWRLVDCSFGVFGFIPLWFCRKWTFTLEHLFLRIESGGK
jgi:hypothetical protein